MTDRAKAVGSWIASAVGLASPASSSPPVATAAAAAAASAKPFSMFVYSMAGGDPNTAKSIAKQLTHEGIVFKVATGVKELSHIPRTGPVVVFCCSIDALNNARARSPGALFVVSKDYDNTRKGDNVLHYTWDDGVPDSLTIKSRIVAQAAECAAAAKLRDVSRQLKRTMQTEKVHTTDQALQRLNIGPAKATRVAELTAIRLRGMALAYGVTKFAGFNIAHDDDTTAPIVHVVDVPDGFGMPDLFPGQVPPADIYLARSALAEALWEQVPAWQKGGSNVYALPRGATDAQTRAIILVAARRLPFVPPSTAPLLDLTEDMSRLVVNLFPPKEEEEEEEEAAAE